MTTPMSTAAGSATELIERVRALAPLSDADLARATGTTDEVAGAWREGRGEPRDWQLVRLQELHDVVALAADVVKADTIALWLREPIPRLHDRVALDVIAGGEHEEVLAVMDELRHGAFS